MAFVPKLVRTTKLGEATADRYRETRRELLAAADRLIVRMKEAEPVRTMEEMDALLALDRDRSLLIGMISDCSYAIEWLETGRRPGLRRGVERRAAYQREIPTDPARLPQPAAPDAYSPLDEEETEGSGARTMDELRLAAAMRGLSGRERDCFTLSQGHGHSYAEIAELLGIGKSSVGTYVLRAQRKIAANVGGAGPRNGARTEAPRQDAGSRGLVARSSSARYA